MLVCPLLLCIIPQITALWRTSIYNISRQTRWSNRLLVFISFDIFIYGILDFIWTYLIHIFLSASSACARAWYYMWQEFSLCGESCARFSSVRESDCDEHGGSFNETKLTSTGIITSDSTHYPNKTWCCSKDQMRLEGSSESTNLRMDTKKTN